MEADWEFEVGGDAPVIEAFWPGFVDLQRAPERAGRLPEAAQLPALAQTLATLNAPASPVWTSKCDVWPHLESDEFDPDELDAPPGCSAHAMGCYIDLLPKSDRQWSEPDLAAAACKRVVSLLRDIPLRCCRADLVIRRAFFGAERMDLGITACLTACGPSIEEGKAVLLAALAALAHSLSDPFDAVASPGSKNPESNPPRLTQPSRSGDAAQSSLERGNPGNALE